MLLGILKVTAGFEVILAIYYEKLAHFSRINSHAALDIGANHAFRLLDKGASKEHQNCSSLVKREEWSMLQHPHQRCCHHHL